MVAMLRYKLYNLCSERVYDGDWCVRISFRVQGIVRGAPRAEIQGARSWDLTFQKSAPEMPNTMI